MLHELFEQYMLRNLRDSSPHTLRLWGIALRHLDRFLDRPATIEDLNEETICRFSMWRRNIDKVAAATVNRDLACILALWRWAHKTGRTSEWPEVPLLRVPTRVPQAWMQAEFDRLIDTARSTDGIVGKVPAAHWWTALLLLLFDTGERIGAAMKLTWQQVDLINGWVLFQAESRKGQAADNFCQIATDTAVAIARVRQDPERVFFWPYCQTYLWKRYTKLVEKAGLPAGRLSKFHRVRRTTASYVEAAGGNATAVLGHANRKTTLRYLDPRIAQKPQPVDVLWRPGHQEEDDTVPIEEIDRNPRPK